MVMDLRVIAQGLRPPDNDPASVVEVPVARLCALCDTVIRLADHLETSTIGDE